MELYKLYCKLKRYTGYETMLDTIRRILMPEEYEERRRSARRVLAQMAVLNSILNTERWLN